jgi:hypothetical protein
MVRDSRCEVVLPEAARVPAPTTWRSAQGEHKDRQCEEEERGEALHAVSLLNRFRVTPLLRQPACMSVN